MNPAHFMAFYVVLPLFVGLLVLAAGAVAAGLRLLVRRWDTNSKTVRDRACCAIAWLFAVGLGKQEGRFTAEICFFFSAGFLFLFQNRIRCTPPPSAPPDRGMAQESLARLQNGTRKLESAHRGCPQCH